MITDQVKRSWWLGLKIEVYHVSGFKRDCREHVEGFEIKPMKKTMCLRIVCMFKKLEMEMESGQERSLTKRGDRMDKVTHEREELD